MQNLQKQVYHKNRFQTPKATPKQNPKGTKFESTLAVVESQIKILNAYIELNTLVIAVNKDDVFATLEILSEYGYDMLSEMSAIHLMDDTFEVFYQILSMERVLRVRVKAITDKEIDSVERIYRNAVWCEREAYDMFGIIFLNHPYLKRLLMPDDWVGYPLRKDYPLQGDESAQWYEVDKIFGKENRDRIGAEQRNASFVDENDTYNFAHLGYEVPVGAPPKRTPTEVQYQEPEGVFIVTKFDKKKQKHLEKRR